MVGCVVWVVVGWWLESSWVGEFMHPSHPGVLGGCDGWVGMMGWGGWSKLVNIRSLSTKLHV